MNYNKIKKACERIDGVSIVLQESGCQCIVQSSADFSAEDKIAEIAECGKLNKTGATVVDGKGKDLVPG
ncbi:MAG: hypothetical protein ACSW8H_10725, partial [bacterium]